MILAETSYWSIIETTINNEPTDNATTTEKSDSTYFIYLNNIKRKHSHFIVKRNEVVSREVSPLRSCLKNFKAVALKPKAAQ